MARPPLNNFAMLLATAGGTGLLPWAPGSFGSVVGVALAALVVPIFGVSALLVACLILFLSGWWAAGRVARVSAIADPGFVVIDEVVGQGLVLATVPPSIVNYAGGFMLFRLFDIIKPWPINAVERRFRNGFGIMADDLMAAVYAGVGLYCVVNIFE
ncbi:MAG TPA: phosphatidylglycerophosphatase A [Stellaceae bacterium]|nr:phosphatidylglycerophosphatase A [Stellaceae bacterium]